ncbi:MAG: sugar kinase [Ktedonobacterales bacterium]|nr:sugar kinase [Ktedonobacterales bacterium]
MSITVVGTIGIDDIETPFGRVERTLGGSAAYFALAAANYEPVNLIAVVGEDLPAHSLDPLRGDRIDLTGIEQGQGPNFRWGGRYHMDFNTRDTLFTELGVLADFQPKMPGAYRDAAILFLANLQPSVQMQVIEQAPNARLVALDTMNFWISSARDDLTRVLGMVDMVFMAEDELREFAGIANLRAAAQRVMNMGPKFLVIKLGSYGALLLGRDGTYFAAPAFPLDEVRDPTGAGDSFAGGFLGSLAAALANKRELGAVDYRRALLHGNIMGAFACEAFGVERFASLTRTDLDARYNQLVSYTHIDGGA